MSLRSTPRRGASERPEQGSAVVDFVLVSSLVIVLFLGMVQVAVFLHVRATAIDCASEGARSAARAGGSLAAGEDRARELLAASLSPGYADAVTARHVDLDGLAMVEVSVSAPVPLIGLWGPAGGLSVVGRSVVEAP